MTPKDPEIETRRERLDAITGQIIGASYEVGNSLGPGFLEKGYENSLAHLLRKTGLCVEQQRAITVRFDGIVVGEYCADLLVESAVLVELKGTKALDDAHFAQCMNYLKATGLPVCLLINFGGPKVEVKRIVRGF